MTEERKVKGVALVGLVELIRKNDDKPWDQYLTPEDMKLVDTMFMPSDWYPLEFSQRLVTAFAKIFLKDDPSLIDRLAKFIIDDMANGPYKPFILVDDPLEAITKLLQLQDRNYNFSSSQMEKVGEKSLTVHLAGLGETDENFDYFKRYLGFMLKELATMNGAKNVSLTVSINKDGKDTTIDFNLEWE